MPPAGPQTSRQWPKVVLACILAGIGLVALFLVLGVVVRMVTWPDVGPRRERGCRDSELAHIRAATTGDQRALRDALDEGTDPDATDEAGNSALACAGPKGHIAIVRALLDAGADPGTVARDGDAVAEDAVLFCQPEVLGLLLAAGAPVEPHPGAEVDLWAHTVDQGDVATAEVLLDHGVDPRWEPGDTLEWGDTTTSPCPEPTEAGRTAVLDRALAGGGDPQIVLAEGVAWTYPSVVRSALAAGADPDGPAGPSLEPATTFSSLAHQEGRPPPSRAPVEGPEASTEPPDGMGFDDWLSTTPVILQASWKGDVEIVVLLLGAGVDPAAPDADGWTALHAATAGSHDTIVQALLAAGAPPAPEGAPLRPLEVAEAKGDQLLVALLAEAEAGR